MNGEQLGEQRKERWIRGWMNKKGEEKSAKQCCDRKTSDEEGLYAVHNVHLSKCYIAIPCVYTVARKKALSNASKQTQPALTTKHTNLTP